jgi:hypothetical protein
MNVQPRPPTRHGPPRRGATAGDTVFALGIAGFGLVLAGALFAAGGGAPWLARYLPGAPASGSPRAPTSAPSSRASAGPIAPASSTPGGAATPGAVATPRPTTSPIPSPTRVPAAGPFTMNLYRRGVFVHQVDKDACVAAAVQNTLNVIRLREDGRKPDVSAKTQLALYDRLVGLTTAKDSHNGGTGPGGWAALLTEEGYPYELRVYETRGDALRAAATSLRATRRPVGILAWGGVHSWVMTGFTATADPATGKPFTVTTAYVLDPWYPWVSSRWPRSEAPNAPRSVADLKANIVPWKLGSGPYPDRDGKYLVVVPLAH